MRYWQIITISFLIFYLSPIKLDAQHRTVSIIIDGDRIILSDGSKVKLAGVDAPEKHPSAKLSRDALMFGKSEELVIRQGKIAANYLADIVGGRQVIIHREDRDEGSEYGPAIVEVLNAWGRPEFMLNRRMIADGYAIVDNESSLNELPDFFELEQIARNLKRGLWREQTILVQPEQVQSSSSRAIDVTGNCSRDKACLWVSRGAGAGTTGVWKSRPGRKCRCAEK